MKRFKKLTIYVLVGVLLSSSVMMSYKKAEVVQASATLTLGTGALLMLGILGAYGIVYKGAVDSATGEYIWKGDRGLYPHEVEQAEEWFSNMYDNAVRNWCAQNGKDPDDWNGDDDGDGDDMDEIIEQPPLWNTLVGSSVATNQEMMKKAIKITGALAVILTDVVKEFKNKVDDNENAQYLYPMPLELTTSQITKLKDLYNQGYTMIGYSYQLASPDYWRIYIANPQSGSFNFTNYSFIAYGYISSNGSLFTATGGAYQKYSLNKNYPIYVNFDENKNQVAMHQINGNTEDSQYMLPSHFANDSSVDLSQNYNTPVLPQFYFPSIDKIESLLDGLENSTGDDTGTQNAVDTFVDSLGQTETEPDTGGNEGTGTNPDTGGQGGTGGDNEGNEDEENGMFLADLKNVFPFCIPFDLVDCFRLFNAEPETPRVEVPLHFGIVEKDYTFVIDLKDFDGVAEICRSMFLILYIVGLVMATRPLIRG